LPVSIANYFFVKNDFFFIHFSFKPAGMNKQYSEKEQTALLEEAQDHVLALFNQHQDSRLVYHNYQFTAALAGQVQTLAEEEQLAQEDRCMALLAAWFANVGYLFDYQDYAYYSKMEAEKFLLAQEYDENSTKKVLQIITLLKKNKAPQNKVAQVLNDAYTITSVFSRYEERTALLKLEWEFLLDRSMPPKEWNVWKLQRLLNSRLYTHCARNKYEPELARLIQQEKAVIDNNKENTADPKPEIRKRRFGDIEKKVPERGIQTYFRANYRNHINLSAIADNKANIMISVNTILISVLITVLSYRNITETTPMILLPVVMFLVTGLASLIFAVLSARPKITSLNKKALPPADINKNIVFFGNFVKLTPTDFEKAMDEMFNDSELLYGNMTRDLYHLGKVLDKKYRYLTVSYNVFMVGFIATVLTFLIVLLK